MSYPTGTAGLPRDLNRVAVLRLLGASGPLARTTIARELGLSPATVTSVTRELLRRGIVREAAQLPSNGGRPPVLLELVGGAATAFGVKIAPDHLVGVRVDLDAEVLERYEAKLDVAKANAADRIAEILGEWVSGGAAGAPLLGVGLGVPGVVDAGTATVNAPNLGWHDVALSSIVQERLHVPVLVDNDVNTLAIAERLYGRGRDVEHFVTVTVGRGIGLGIVAGGDIYRGSGGGAGEFGHVSAVDDGARCSCGRSGCLETVVADPALVAQGRQAGILSPRQGIARLRTLADSGDQTAQAIFASAGEALGRAVANLVNILSPGLVLVSGEGTQAWPHLAASFETAFRSHVFPPLARVEVEVDPWDDMKWAIGAAALVLRATFTPQDALDADNAIRAWLLAKPGELGVVA